MADNRRLMSDYEVTLVNDNSEQALPPQSSAVTNKCPVYVLLPTVQDLMDQVAPDTI